MARPKLGDSDTERLHVKITAHELDAIDDWRYTNRIPSRSEAVRRLVQIGLQSDRSLLVIRERADETYEFMTGQFETVIEDFKKSADLNEGWRIMMTRLMTMCVDSMRMVGNLGSTARQAADQSEAMKGNAAVPELIDRSKTIAGDYERTNRHIAEIMSRFKGEK